MHKFLFYNKFIIHLYMFRALCAHHHEEKIVLYSICITTPVGGRPVHRLREDCEVVSFLSRDFKLDRHFETDLLTGSKQQIVYTHKRPHIIKIIGHP